MKNWLLFLSVLQLYCPCQVQGQTLASDCKSSDPSASLMARCQNGNTTGNGSESSAVICQESGVEADRPRSDLNKLYTRLDELNRKLLLKDVELERFNIRFRNANNVQGRWRGPRYFLSQEANTITSTAGAWAGVATRAKPIFHRFILGRNKKGEFVQERRLAFRIGLEDALIPQMVGQTIGSFGSAFELGVNLWHDHEARKLSLDPVAADKYVVRIKGEILSLLAQRAEWLDRNSNELPATHLQLATAQGLVLSDLCNLALNEYARFHIGTRRYRTFQDAIFVLDITRNMTGVAGNIVAEYATVVKRGSANAPAGVCNLVSACLTIASPVAARVIGKAAGGRAAQQLKSLVASSEHYDLLKFESDLAKIPPLLKSAARSGPVEERFFTRTEEIQSLNELSTQLHRKKFELANRETRAGTRAATQNVAAGAVIGGNKIMSGLGYMIAGFRFYHRPLDSNFLIADGGLTSGIGGTLGAADNLRIQVRSELQRRNLRQSHLLPGQILSEHMQKLDEIERRLQSLQEQTGTDDGSR